jgi:SAM-dependent methyltransferase
MTPAELASHWKPTKFVLRNGQWRPSSDPAELAPASVVSSSLALRACVAALGEFATGHLADFGCGKAPFFGVYGPLTSQVTGIDWPQTRHEAGYIDVYADLNEPIDLADSSFDTILSSSVLEHIWRHDVLWGEMARTLKPGGHLILSVPFVYALHEVPHDYFRWTRFALEKACSECGLEPVRLEPYGGGLDVLADLCVRALGAISPKLAGLMGRAVVKILQRGAARKLSSTTFEQLPLGYILVARKS